MITFCSRTNPAVHSGSEVVACVIVDGEVVQLIDGSYTIAADNAAQLIEVIDKAGNSTLYHVTVYQVYTVTYVADGTVIDVQTVGYGLDAVEPTIPAKSGYTAIPTTDAPGSDGPDTGDHTQILLLGMMAIYSMLALVLLFLRGKREYQK